MLIEDDWKLSWITSLSPRIIPSTKANAARDITCQKPRLSKLSRYYVCHHHYYSFCVVFISNASESSDRKRLINPKVARVVTFEI